MDQFMDQNAIGSLPRSDARNEKSRAFTRPSLSSDKRTRTSDPVINSQGRTKRRETKIGCTRFVTDGNRMNCRTAKLHPAAIGSAKWTRKWTKLHRLVRDASVEPMTAPAVLTEAEKEAKKAASKLLYSFSIRPPPHESGLLLDLTGENEQAFTECLGPLTKTFGRNRGVSREAIGRALQDALILANGSKPNASPDQSVRLGEAKQRLADVLLTPPVVWEVLESLDEIVVQHRERVGRVIFEPMPKSIGQARKRVLRKFDQTNAWAEAQLAEFLNRRTLVMVDVLAGDRTAAEELGHRAIEDAVALVHLFDSGFSETTIRDRKAVIRRKGAIDYSLATEGEASRSHVQGARTNHSVSAWRAAVSLLGKTTLSEIEQRQLRALRWSRRAGATRDPHAAVLQYVIGLETMLGKNRGNRSELIYRCAWLFKTPKERKRVAMLVDVLYATRNDVVHGENTDFLLTPRFKARQLFLEAFAKMSMRKDLRRMTSEQFDAHWGQHRLT